MTGSLPCSRPLAALAALGALIALGACRQAVAPDRPVPDRAAVAADADEIPWFPGSVEEAFAAAKAERRPLFLYWGAVWCPPCHALRTRLFVRPEFRARLAATVPVYLDGDTGRAQIWGEKLGTEGYPTVIVFDADGREVTRIPSMLPVEQYGEVLARALDATRPIAALVATAASRGPAALTPAELNLLAFYSWSQDHAVGLDLAARRDLFSRCWRETPAERRLERSRFLALALQVLAAEAEDSPPPALGADERRELAAAAAALLADPELARTNTDLVFYFAAPVVRLLAPVAGPERDRLVGAWIAAARRLEEDAALSIDERLTTLAPQLALSTLAAGKAPGGGAAETPPDVPPDLQQRVRDRVRWAGAVVTDENELQAVMDTMAGLLEDAGLEGEARSLLAAKLADTTAPYYYLGYLAALEARAGHAVEAVARYREAWRQARAAAPGGAAMTPFRWGSRYLRQAMKLTPDAVDVIAADAETILADLLASPDAFAGGNWSRLSELWADFDAWSAGDAARRAPAVARARARVAAVCGALADGEPGSAGSRCRELIASARERA